MNASSLMISIKKSCGLELAELLFPLLVGQSNKVKFLDVVGVDMVMSKCEILGWKHLSSPACLHGAR